MEAYENGHLLPTWSSDSCNSRRSSCGALWCVAACASVLILLLQSVSWGSSVQMHTTQSTNRIHVLPPLSANIATSVVPIAADTARSTSGAPMMGFVQSQASGAMNDVFSHQSFVIAGGALAAMFSLLFGLMLRKPQSDIAMATVTGQIDKGGDPTDMGSDAETERHRIDQRVVFSNERWRTHRAGSRFFRALLTIPQSYVVRHVVSPVLVISTVSAVVCAAQAYFGFDSTNLPTSLFSLSAPSLGLLLVFRTNASYERWDGARKMIGLVKNRTEDMTRQISVRFPATRQDLKEQMMRYIQAFPFALKVHLRSGPGGFEDDNNLIEDLTPILKPNELQLLLKATNRPAHVMQCMTQIVHSTGLDGAALLALDQNLTTLADVLGGCERILRTPIPLSYTRMTTRFLFVWLLLLPLALSAEIIKLNHSVWLTIPAVAFIAFVLLGIEEVAVQIEEPFTILPLEAYSEGIRKNTSSIFAQMNAVSDFFRNQ